jgi:hypothetical protein
MENMNKRFVLKEIHGLDDMHDERIDRIEQTEDRLILYYDKIEHLKGCHSCKVTFLDVDGAFVEVRKKEKTRTISKIFDIDEFVHLISKRKCQVETIDYYCGLHEIKITGALVSESGYDDNCIFTIPASELIYQWE